MSKAINNEDSGDQVVFETLVVRKEEGVLFAEISAPPMNLLGPELVRDLVSLIQQAEADDSLQVLVFKSADPDYFISHVELYADAPELGRVALEKGLPDLTREMAAATGKQSAGRVGARQGKVSELTSILPIAEGGAKRLRGLLQLLEGNFKGADVVGTLHDMRFVFLDNDTKLLFATAYDGEWNAYIDDFVTKISLWLRSNG